MLCYVRVWISPCVNVVYVCMSVCYHMLTLCMCVLPCELHMFLEPSTPLYSERRLWRISNRGEFLIVLSFLFLIVCYHPAFANPSLRYITGTKNHDAH